MSRVGRRNCQGPDRARGSRQLRFEPLETRRLLALAEFNINLFQDDAGTPGAPIEAGTVQAGDAFFLEIVAEDVRPDPRGLHGVSLDVMWDPNAFKVADSVDVSKVVTDSLPLLRFGTLEPDIGRINDLNGSTGFGAGAMIGLEGPQRFALIRFEALQPIENGQFSLRGGKYGIEFSPTVWYQRSNFAFETESIRVVPANTSAPTALPREVLPALSTTESVIATNVAEPSVTVAEATSDAARIELPIESVAKLQIVPASPIVIEQAQSVAPDGLDQSKPLDRDDELVESDHTPEVSAGNETPAPTFVGPRSLSGRKLPQRNVAPTIDSTDKACSFSFVQRTAIVSTQRPPSDHRTNAELGSRPRLFIGPLQPGEWARHLVFAERATERASNAIPRHLEDELVDVLASNLNSQQRRQTL